MSYSALDLGVRGPRIAERRISVEDVVLATGKDNPREAYEYWGLSTEEVTQALEFYLDRPSEFEHIDIGPEDVEAVLQDLQKPTS